MAHELEVWLFDDHVGTLSLVGGDLIFVISPLGYLSQRLLDCQPRCPCNLPPSMT